MNRLKKNDLISALFMAVLGVLFIILKKNVVGISMTVFGALFIIFAIISLISKRYTVAAVQAIIGALIIVLGWVLVDIALFIFAILLLLFGILQLVGAIQGLSQSNGILAKIIGFAKSAICIALAIFLLINNGAVVEWVFIIAGIFFILEGVISLINYFAIKD